MSGRRLLAIAAAALVTLPAVAYTPLAFLDQVSGDEEVGWLYWQQIRDGEPVPFAISVAGTPDVQIPANDPGIDEFEAIRLAFETWEAVPGTGLEFDVQDTTTNAYGYDGENVIFFDDLGNFGYGAITLITYDNTTGQLLDVDIHMNDHTTRWITSQNGADGEPLPCPCEGNDPDASFNNDIQGLATHEIGHALGLDHSGIGKRESAETPTMYPRGIWFVPGSDVPPNSHYRSLELDDELGLQHLYPPANQAATTATIVGVVHDRYDRPTLGAQVVARDTQSGVEVGVMSGVLPGPIDPGAYALPGLPPGEWELHARPVDGSPPGLVGRQHFGGIVSGLLQLRMQPAPDLDVMYHRLAPDRTGATPVQLSAGETEQVRFRPLAGMRKLPRFFPHPRQLPLEGVVNTDVTGPVDQARLVVRVGNDEPQVTPIPVDGTFSVEVPPRASGTLVEYHVEVDTLAGEQFATPTERVQLGLSKTPLILVSKNGSGQLAAVDAENLLEIDVTPGSLSFPLGHVFHRPLYGAYVANFGDDTVSFVPFSRGTLPPRRPMWFDVDGDGLLDSLESAFGTGVDDPDSDGDLSLDGDEVSEMRYVAASPGQMSFELVGGVVAQDGTPIGGPRVGMAIRNESTNQWVSSVQTLTPSGRYRVEVAAGSSYRLAFYDLFSNAWIANSPTVSGISGGITTTGVVTLPVTSSGPVEDSGTDPLDSLDGPLGLMLPVTEEVFLGSGADPYGMVLGPRSKRYLYVTGFGSNRLYKIDTFENVVVDQATVGTAPKGLTIGRDGSRLYVANSLSDDVSVLDTETLDVIETIAIDGSPQYVRISQDGRTAVVTSIGATDVTFIDTATNAVLDEVSTPVPLGLVFLSGPSRHDLVLAGTFVVGGNEVAVIDHKKQEVRIIDLGPGVNTTSGIAINSRGDRGYVVHYQDPELLEIDLTSGDIVRTLPFDFIDIRDISMASPVSRRRVRGALDPRIERSRRP